MNTIIKLVFTAAVLLTIAYKFDFGAALRLLSTVPVGPLIGCILLLLLQAWLAAARLARIVSLFGHRLGLAASYRLTLQGMFFNQAFISFLGGDAFRIWRIHRAQVSLADAARTVVLDRVVGFAVNHLALVAMLPWVLGGINNNAIALGLVALAVGGLAGIALLLLLGVPGTRLALINRLPAPWRTSRAALLSIEMATIGRHVLEARRRLWAIAALSALVALVNCLVFFAILRGLGVAFPLALACALLVPGIMEIALLPLSIAGWGLREGAALLGFPALGLGSEIALAASVAFGALGLAVGLLGGIAWLFDDHGRAAASPATAGAMEPAASHAWPRSESRSRG